MTKNKHWFQKTLISTLWILIPIVVAIILRVFFFEIYKIPSSSMEPTLIPGDYIMVSKMSYGARLLKWRKFFHEKKIEYVRTKGWGHIKKNDVFVFNWPNYGTLKGSFSNMFGDCVVKRCYGLPGDTMKIKNEEIKGMKGMKGDLEGPKADLFPHDSTLQWTLNSYGPLYVPAKGDTIYLSKKNVAHYIDILRYENPGAKIEDSILFVNNTPVTNYIFKHNYYFMLGDNFYGSQDSRYWGLVPEENIIGKAVLIFFSNGENGFLWKRLDKLIK
jgi:signal peptidase I